MWRFAVLMVMASVVSSCSPDAEVTGSTNKCATDIYPSYNPKALDQCVAVCIKCDRGAVTTCSTSCTLKALAEAATRPPEGARIYFSFCGTFQFSRKSTIPR